MQQNFEQATVIRNAPRRCPNCGNTLLAGRCSCDGRQDGGQSTLTIAERVAYLHRDALALRVGDPCEVKFALLRLIDDATDALEMVRGEIHRQRRVERAALIL